jgi:long-subunit acyl-CoA synthetase (AMP-forming)
LSGICSPANAAYSVEELVYQLKTSKPKAMFTCVPLLPIALEAAAQTGIPKNRIYMLELPKQATGGEETPKEYMTVDQLIELGKEQPKLEELKWEKGQGARQTAFLCYSSGTSGLPVGSSSLIMFVAENWGAGEVNCNTNRAGRHQLGGESGLACLDDTAHIT